MKNQNKNIFTVSKLNRLARTVLESEIGRVWVSAEISNFVAATSGHWYFTLKDTKAQVKAAMFKGANRHLMFRPKEGDKVLVRASIGLYEPRGDYQLIVEHLEADGEGLLKQQFEKLKIQLSAEGLFASQNKKPLPDDVRKIGVITSSTGAALHDIITVLKRRSPTTEIVIYPSQVQGQGASAQLATAIQIANFRNEVDILIVGRGGGSLEDLWCFNDETVARAIYKSDIPIISAVGHEVDVSIADFVADIRAATPSAAAELASRDQQQLYQRIDDRVQQLHQVTNNKLLENKGHLTNIEHRLQQNHPNRQLQQRYQYLDQLQNQLLLLTDKKLNLCKMAHSFGVAELEKQAPEQQLQLHKEKLAHLSESLHKGTQRLLERKRQQLASGSHILDTVSPLATLSRGYSITFNNDQLVKSVKQVKPGDVLVSQLSDGLVTSTITSS